MTRTRIWNPENSQLAQPFPVEDAPVLTLNYGSLEGYITMELIHKDTKKVEERREFKNVITDWWLDTFGMGETGWDDMMQYYCVGDGDVSGGISAHSQSLYHELWRTNNNGQISDTGSWTPNPTQSMGGYWSAIRTRLFLEGEANGVLTEIGASNGFTGKVSTHSAIRDATGSLAPITKTLDFQLRITYEVRLTPPTELSSGSFVMNSNTYNYVIGPNRIDYEYAWGTTRGAFYRFGFIFPGGEVDGNGNIFAPGFRIRAEFREYTNPPTISGSAWAFSGSFGVPDFAFTGIYNAGTFVTASYVSGTFQRDVKLICEPGSVNFGAGIGGLLYTTNQWADQAAVWGIKFIPPIPKNDRQRFIMILRHTWGRSADSE